MRLDSLAGGRTAIVALVAAGTVWGCRASAPTAALGPGQALVDHYLAAYFETYPTRATQAGDTAGDRVLEHYSAARLAAWTERNRRLLDSARGELVAARGADLMVDLRLILQQAEREAFDLEVRHTHATDPGFWVRPIAEATVFLLLRPEQPLAARYDRARARVRDLPRFAGEAVRALRTFDPGRVSREGAESAAEQVRAAAEFYRGGFVAAGAGLPDTALTRAANEGRGAAVALDTLGSVLEQLAAGARGSARLGPNYQTIFRLETGIRDPVDLVLSTAEHELADIREEAARYGRTVWPAIGMTGPPPADDRVLLRALFGRLAASRDDLVGPYLEYWQQLVPKLEAFVRDHHVATLPEPRSLTVTTAPAFMAGQSIGGVFAAGPFAPDATTFLFVPVPPAGADSAARARFFSDFNRPFTAMIAAHELMPGHYLQGKTAARSGHPVRAIFADPVYVEGWGTFSERVMLEAGWGGPIEWLAHYKKQLENAARLIVDIRVHTRNMSEVEMVNFVRDEALQGEQLARNMWLRTLTTAPQITSYHLGYRQLRAIHQAARDRAGAAFSTGAFMDRMMSLGSAPIALYREMMVAQP